MSATKLTVTFNARGSATIVLNKYVAAATNDGLNIDGTVALVDVADGLNTTTYLDASTADFVMENRAAGGAVMTPINNAFLVYLPNATTLLTQAQIDAAKASVGAATPVAAVAGVNGAYIFYNGKSIRVSGSGTATPDRPQAGMCFLVLSAGGDIARMVVETVTGTDDATVTYTVYSPSTTPGVLLYKK